MPRLSEEITDWDELPEEKREAYRAALRDLGMAFSEDDQADPDEDDCCD